MAKAKDHQRILHEFRAILEERDLIYPEDTIGTDDAVLLRFLRARQFDLNKAIVMWTNCQHWRKTAEGIGIDQLYRELDPYDYPERDNVFDCWPLWYHKTDKLGRPINIQSFGGINMPELYKHVTPQRFWKTILANAESLTREVLPASSRAAGKHIEGTFVIVDLKGFGIAQFWQMKNLARDAFQVAQDYYPETMAQLAIVNAPASFTTIWSLIKPWLAKETVAKVDIFGANYTDELLRQIDAESLPTLLGGKCTCEGLGGCSRSNLGPWMDGRKERRERWLRGERSTPANSDEEEEAVAGEQWTDALEDQANVGVEKYGKETEVVGAEGDVEKEVTGPLETEGGSRSTPPSSDAPSTPDSDDLRKSTARLSLDEGGPHKSQESTQEVLAQHPGSRLPLTVDLQKDVS